MTTSTLYHTHGIRGCQYEKTERQGHTETYYLRSTATKVPCARCRSRDTRLVDTGRIRRMMGLHVGLKKRRSKCGYAGWSVPLAGRVSGSR